MLKKIMAMVVVAMVLCACFATAVPAMAAAAPQWGEIGSGGLVPLYSSEEFAESRDEMYHGSYGVRFNALYDFTRIDIGMFYSTEGATVQFFLYNWMKDYDTTVAQTPVWSTSHTKQRPQDRECGTWIEGYTEGSDPDPVTCKRIPAGEYLLVVSLAPDQGDKVVYFDANACVDPDKFEYFDDGYSIDDVYSDNTCIAGGIRIEDTPSGDAFGELSVPALDPTQTPDTTQEPSASKAPQATKIPTTTDSEVSNTLTPDSGDAEDPAGSNVILYILLAVGGVAIVAAVVVIVVKSKKK